MSNQKKKILIIEDEEFLLDIYKKKFEGLGFIVIARTDGNNCLELVKKEKVDLILLDIILPGKDGYQILEELKKDRQTSPIKVVVLSNLGQKEEIDKALKLGATDYVIKANLTPKELVEKVIKMI
jgi:CheY-like chemotaxis protein